MQCCRASAHAHPMANCWVPLSEDWDRDGDGDGRSSSGGTSKPTCVALCSFQGSQGTERHQGAKLEPPKPSRASPGPSRPCLVPPPWAAGVEGT